MNTPPSLLTLPATLSVALGGVVQLVRTPACHAGGRGFESRRSRSFYKPLSCIWKGARGVLRAPLVRTCQISRDGVGK